MISRRKFTLRASSFIAAGSLAGCQPAAIWVAIRAGMKLMATRSIQSTAVAFGQEILVGRSVHAAERAAHMLSGVSPYGVRHYRSAKITYNRLNEIVDFSQDVISATISPLARKKWEISGDESPAAAVTAYFSLARENKLEQILSFWVNPDPNLEAFKIITTRARAEYLVDDIETLYQSSTAAQTRVEVRAANDREQLTPYTIDIYWMSTEAGWLISDFRSIS